jgi:hypothetical protein
VIVFILPYLHGFLQLSITQCSPMRPHILIKLQKIAVKCIILVGDFNMSKNKQQLDSQLHCRSTASLQASVTEDLNAKDKSIKDLLKEDANGCSDEETKDDEPDDC